MNPASHKAASTWITAKRALACAKPRFRTIEQVNEIADLLLQQTVFEGVEKDDLLAIAYFVEAKHCEAGECILSKGQPMETWYLMLDGTALMTRYSSQRGEHTTSTLGLNDTWSEAALLHSTHPRRSSVTVIAGQQGCITLRMRYTDFDAINDPRQVLQLLAPEGTQGPPAVAEIAAAQRRAASLAILCCCLRRLASARPPSERTPEEASELEPFFSALPAYRSYPPELVACLAATCRPLTLPPGGIIYERGTLADAHVTVMKGEVQLRKFGGSAAVGGADDGDWEGGGGGGGAGAAGGRGTVSGSAPPSASLAGPSSVTPLPPATQQAPEASDASGSRLSIRARLRREREARKAMQRQLDEYVSRMDSDVQGSGGSRDRKDASTSGGSAPVDWTRVFMQKAMRTAEPVWKALHPADNTRRRRQAADSVLDNPLDEEPITEVAQLLGPAAAKAYYRGLQTQGYSDTESPTAAGRGSAAGPSGHSVGGAGGSASGEGSGTVRDKWRKMMFSVDGPETDKERTLRNMAMRASRIYRDQRSRKSVFDADEVEETYGPLLATVTRGSPVGELSTVMLHGTMRKESALAGPTGCELLLVDWEAFQQGVLAARTGLLARAAGFLAALPKERLTRLAELCLCLSVDAGTLLARQSGPLESMVVVQSGELQLIHEPSATIHTRISTFKGQAVYRSRNGRTQAMPLLASLSNAAVPGVPPPAAASGSGAGAGSAASGPSPPAASPPVPPPPVFAGGPAAEITLQGLPMGEVCTGAILGEAILGTQPPGPPLAPGHGHHPGHHGHNDPSQPAGKPASASLTGPSPAPEGPNIPHPHGPAAPPWSAHAHPHSHTHSDAHAPAPVGGPGGPAGGGAGEGPKWPATVLAARASVLLVIPKSVLYLAEFDGMRPQLMRFAAERKSWMAKRIEAAYREAAAPATVPAVFASATATAAAALMGTTAAAGAGSLPSPPSGQQLTVPSLRRSAVSVASNSGTAAAGARMSTDGGAAAASAAASASGSGVAESPPRRAISSDVSGLPTDATEADAGATGAAGPPTPQGSLGISRRRSVESFPRFSSPSTSSNHNQAAAAAAAATTGLGGPLGSGGVSSIGGSTNGAVPPRLANNTTKWDFLDSPTGATSTPGLGPEASNTWMSPLAFASGNSFARSSMCVPSSLLDSGGFAGAAGSCFGGSFTAAAGPYGSMPLRRPSSGAMRAAAGGPAAACDVSYGLTPVQQALMEAGFDPAVAVDAVRMDTSPGSARRGSIASGGGGTLPSLNPAGVGGSAPPTRLAVTPPAHSSLSGGPSPAASIDFDSLRTGSTTPPFRSPNALTPTPRRSYSGTPVGLGSLPPSASAPTSLLDQGFGSAVNVGRPASPNPTAAAAAAAAAAAGSAQLTTPAGSAFPAVSGQSGSRRRSSYTGHIPGGTAMGARRGTDLDPLAPPSPRNPNILSSAPSALPSRVPGLAAVEMFEAVAAASAAAAAAAGPPSSPGLYTRNARSSYTGGMPLRNGGVEPLWAPSGEVTRRVGIRVGGIGGMAPPAATTGGGTRGGMLYDVGGVDTVEAEEEVALAKSLVPKNQAGMFMVREGLSSTPTKQPAARRIANCF